MKRTIFPFVVGSEGDQAKAEAAKALLRAKLTGKMAKRKPKSGFAKDLADVSNKNVKKHRYLAHSDRSKVTKGRGALAKGSKQAKGPRVPRGAGNGGKVSKLKNKRK